MKHYKVGDKVWWAKCGHQSVEKTCPICYGQRQITLILGNGNKVILPCNYCVEGFAEPKGTVTEWEYVIEPEQVIISKVTIEESQDGAEYCYQYGSYVLREDKVFYTKAEALAKCQEIKAELEENQEQSIRNLKKNRQKSFSWNAGYHMREAQKADEDAEHHRKKAILCKARARNKEVK